jgi:hypothetical protein
MLKVSAICSRTLRMFTMSCKKRCIKNPSNGMVGGTKQGIVLCEMHLKFGDSDLS